jgi:hypothetical protein
MNFRHFVTEEPLKLRQKIGGFSENELSPPPLDYECESIA